MYFSFSLKVLATTWGLALHFGKSPYMCYIFFPKNRYKEKSLQSNETGKPQFQNTLGQSLSNSKNILWTITIKKTNAFKDFVTINLSINHKCTLKQTFTLLYTKK